jgi:hypothetical protein
MRRTLVLLLAITTAACAAGRPGAVAGPEGKPTHAVECVDKERDCHKQAEKLCPKGYVVADKKSRAIVSWRGFAAENTLKYLLVVECKE